MNKLVNLPIMRVTCSPAGVVKNRYAYLEQDPIMDDLESRQKSFKKGPINEELSLVYQGITNRHWRGSTLEEKPAENVLW